jgi:hypothetical protein
MVSVGRLAEKVNSQQSRPVTERVPHRECNCRRSKGLAGGTPGTPVRLRITTGPLDPSDSFVMFCVSLMRRVRRSTRLQLAARSHREMLPWQDSNRRQLAILASAPPPRPCKKASVWERTGDECPF